MFYVLHFIYMYLLLFIQPFLFLPSALLLHDVIDRELKSQRGIERERKMRGKRRKRERERERGEERGGERLEWGGKERQR